MFSPIGFVPVSTLYRRMKMDYNALLHAKISSWYYEITDVWDVLPAGGVPNILRKLTVQDYVEYHFLSILKDQLHICSPSGLILKFDHEVFNGRPEYFVVSYSDLQEAVVTNPSLSIPKNFPRLFELVLETPEEALTALRAKGMPYSALGIETGYDLFHQTIPFFHERYGYTITLAGVDLIRSLKAKDPNVLPDIDLSEFEDAVSYIRPFEGWSMCVPDAFANSEWPKQFLAEEDQEPRDQGNGGRPRELRNTVMKAYKTLYPTGHGKIAWLEVARHVERITGISTSVDTLKRAAVEAQKS